MPFNRCNSCEYANFANRLPDVAALNGISTPEQAGQCIVKYALIENDGPTVQYFSEEYLLSKQLLFQCPQRVFGDFYFLAQKTAFLAADGY